VCMGIASAALPESDSALAEMIAAALRENDPRAYISASETERATLTVIDGEFDLLCVARTIRERAIRQTEGR